MATELGWQSGIETALVILGHCSATMTDAYAELGYAKAMKHVG